jgi:hypothetical protein
VTSHRHSTLARGSAVRFLAAGIVIAVVGMVLGAPSSAQAAAPAWSVQMTHKLATFNRLDFADQYTVRVENSGDEFTTGTYVLDDTLPPELTLASVIPGDGWTCPSTEEVISGAPLSCSRAEALAPGESSLALTVKVDVPASAPDTVTNAASISGGGAGAVSSTDLTPVIDRPPFGVPSFTARATDPANGDYTVAGGHPYQGTTSFTLPIYSKFGVGAEAPRPVEELNETYVELPPGFLGNPAAAARCPLVKLQSLIPLCPAASKIGTFDFGVRGPVNHYPLYNLVPEHGYPAEFAFKFANFAIVLYPSIRPRAGSYGVTIGAPGATQFGITSIGVTLFGVPSTQNFSGGPAVPFLSNPVNCSDAHPVSKIALDSWQAPARTFPDRSSGLKVPDLSDPNWKTAVAPAPAVTGCDASALASQFDPSIDAKPIQEGAGPNQAAQPAGLKVDLDFPQSNDPTKPGEAFDPSIPQAPELKNATVKLPAGMAISPSAADGLAGCSDLASDPAGDQVHYDNTFPVTCPDASKIGTVTATSPLLAAHDPVTDAITGPEPVGGDVYIVTPHPGDLPKGANQDGTYRMLIQVESAERGINLKLPGTIVADKQTGQLTASFTDNPQLPISHLTLNLNSGPRAPLATPVTCGSFTTTTDLVPWSTPDTPDATPYSSFAVGSGPNGSGCVSAPQQRPFNPAFSAGTESAKAGAGSPFVLKLTRGDGEQEFSSLDLTTPKGFTAKLAGVPYCSEAAITAAAGKSGAAEQADPSCPAASQVGSLTTGAGPGSDPYYVTGKAYLAGPYKGAPISLVFITPAVAGPFDLGNVLVRAAAFVDPETAQVSVKTDAIPQILDGVPLKIRSIVAHIDRPGFALNPTNCEAKSVSATVGGASGAGATPSNTFQVGDCDKLGFGPKLKIQLKGATRRIGHPALRAVVTAGPGEANISSAQVNLPHGEFLDQGNLNKTCTKPVLLAGGCPATAVYGYARAWTPLLDQPLEGPVYLVGGYGFKLPALVAELNGQIKVLLVGKVDSGSNKGIRNTFELVPDAPVSRFELEMKGGKKYGLLENSEDLCKAPKAQRRANVYLGGQNGKVEQFKPVVANQCGKTKKHKKKRSHGSRLS